MRTLMPCLAGLLLAGCWQIANSPNPKSCPAGSASRFDGSAWQCETVPQQTNPSPCPTGQVVNWNTNGTWGCQSLPASAPLPSAACGVGTASQWDGAEWKCVSVPQQVLPTCNATQAVTWNNGTWGCAALPGAYPIPPGNCTAGVIWNEASMSWQCAQSDSIIPAGTVIAYAGNIVNPPPNGWLWCNGDSYPVAPPYTALYNAIGNIYGVGSGNPTGFKVPNYQGYFLRGFDPNGTVDPGPRQSILAAATPGAGSIEADQIVAHSHGFLANVFGASASGLVDSNFMLTPTTGTPGAGEAYVHPATSSATTPTGGTETRPKNMAVNFLIKY